MITAKRNIIYGLVILWMLGVLTSNAQHPDDSLLNSAIHEDTSFARLQIEKAKDWLNNILMCQAKLDLSCGAKNNSLWKQKKQYMMI